MSIQINNPYSIRLGVLGAGTMGSGIALTALLADMYVTLYDVSPEMLDKARKYIEKHLERKSKPKSLMHLEVTSALEKIRGAGVIVEAIPEDLSLKRDLFARLDALCPPPAILATNTSTLSVTSIAAASTAPERVGGMHFFNPAAVMPLVEIVRGSQTSLDTVRILADLAEKIGKTPVIARDTPGFIVNRVARPFYGEALRLLGERAATPQQIDQIVRMGAGFRMGPFQQMDLIGIDVNLSATQSMYEQTSGEPRYRPHTIQVQMVRQNTLGRKTGRGFYRYDADWSQEDPTPPPVRKCSGQILISLGSWGPGIPQLIRKAGYTISNGDSTRREKPLAGILLAGKSEGMEKHIVQMDRSLPPDVPLFCQCADVTLIEIATWVKRPERLVGFDGLFFTPGTVASLTPSPTSPPHIRASAETLITSLGRIPVWVQDSPGLVLPRIISALANEAAFAAGEGVAEPDTIDQAMRLGTNYPKGPLAWAKEIGYAHVVAILDHLHSEYGEERYRVAPLLRRWLRLEWVSA
jgi:3-hydroxybutyryl-CoA dehydrogenase